MKTIALILLTAGLIPGLAVAQDSIQNSFVVQSLPTLTDEDCSHPSVASSDNGWTMVAYTARGVVTQSFIVTQLIPTHPSITALPDPVTVGPGSGAKLCWSRDGYTLAIPVGTMIQVFQSDQYGNWDTSDYVFLDAGGEVTSIDLWGVPTDAAGPAVFMTWASSTEPWDMGGSVYFSARSGFGWSTPNHIGEAVSTHPFPQVTWSLGPAGPTPTVFYQTMGTEGPSMLFTNRDVETGWTVATPAAPDGSSTTCFGGPFAVVTSYSLERDILGLGPQPTCPCGTIYHQYSTGASWSDCDDLTVDYGAYDWPMSLCLDVETDGTVHALWYQLDSSPDLQPHRGYLEYRTGKQGDWIDAGDFLDNQPSGPVQPELALDISPNNAPVLAWSRRDTIDGEPQFQKIWTALHRYPSPVPDEVLPSPSTQLRAWPNPFNPRVQLSFELKSDQAVLLEVFDSRGRLVNRLLDTVLPAGVHDKHWNGQDQAGKTMPSGVYFARLRTDYNLEVRKLMLTR